MPRLCAILLAFAVCLAFAACGGNVHVDQDDGAGGGGPNVCEQAIAHVMSCAGDVGPLPTTCGSKDQCEAQCFLDADCASIEDLIAGNPNTPGGIQLAGCVGICQ